MRFLTIVALAALLTACATQPGVRRIASLPSDQLAAAEARQQAREATLRDETTWSLTGRIAVSNGRNGGSGRIEWTQNGPRYEVAVSAPVTRQSWRLSGDAIGARLDGLDGGPREGADAANLLLDATGWDIPVAALGDWMRGLRAQGLGTAAAGYGVDGRLAWLEQGGWRLDYEWPAAGDLPAKLDARRDQARVRLIVDQWNAGSAP